MGIGLKIAAIFISLMIYELGEVFIKQDYQTVTSDDTDFKSIKSGDNYEYWECRYNPTLLNQNVASHRIIAQVGNKKYAKFVKKIASKRGFLQACGPAFCFYYIIAIKKDKSIVIIDNYNSFQNFIGVIDNLEEAKLTIRNNGYQFSTSSKYKSSYQQTKSGYNFKLYNLGIAVDLRSSNKLPKMVSLTVHNSGVVVSF